MQKRANINEEELALTFVGSSSRKANQSAALLWRSISLKAFSATEKRAAVSAFMSGLDLCKQR